MVISFKHLLILFLFFVFTNGQRRIFKHVFINSSNQSDSNFECPEEFGYYPHPTDCTHYYVCVFGGPLLESCTGGLMYSHQLQTCDWPRNVNCNSNGQRLITVTTTTEFPVIDYYRNDDYQKRLFAEPTPVIISRGQPRQFINDQIKNVESDKPLTAFDNHQFSKNLDANRQQRVYRGNPSLIGQVQIDRDGLNQINALISNLNGKEKEKGHTVFNNREQFNENKRNGEQNAAKKYFINMIRKKRQILFSSNMPSETRSYFWTSNPHYHSLVPHKTAQKISMPHFFTTQIPPQHTISLPYTYMKTDHNFHYKSNTYPPQNQINYQPTEKQQKFIPNYNYQPIFQQSHSLNSKEVNKNYPLLTLQNFFHSNSFLNEDNNNKNISSEYVSIFEENPNSSRIQQYGIEQELTPLKFLNFNQNKNNYNQTRIYNNKFGYRPTSLYEFHTNTKTNTNINTDFDSNSNPYKITKITNQTNYKQLPDKNYNYNYDHSYTALNNYTVPKSPTISFRSIANQYSVKGSTTSSYFNSNSTKYVKSNQLKENYYNSKNNNNNYNNTKEYDSINYDSFYSMYDDDIELYRDNEYQHENNIKNHNANSKKNIDIVPFKNVPYSKTPQHIFISTASYSGAQTNTEKVKIYDEVESINNKDLSQIRSADKYLVNNNYLEPINMTINDFNLKRATEETRITTAKTTTSYPTYFSESDPMTTHTVLTSEQNDNQSERYYIKSYDWNEKYPTTFTPTQFYSNIVAKDPTNNYFKSSHKPYKIKTVKKNLPTTKFKTTRATTTTITTTTTTTNTTPEPMYTTSTNKLVHITTHQYYSEGKLTEITQNDLLAKSLDDNRNNIDYRTHNTTNSTINMFSIFNENIIDKNNVDLEIKTNMPIIYKQNNLFQNSPSQNVRTFSPKCYQRQPIHLCNDFKMRMSNKQRGSSQYTSTTISSNKMRQRSTLRPSTSLVTKNHQNFVNIYESLPRRPESIYPTPQPDKTAAKCRKDICLLPDCNCGGKDIPGDLLADKVPQIVLLTFDDSVNDLNKGLYNDLFNKGRKNPNGCPITATFYISHEWTDYSQVQNLYAEGHEIASHTISHSFGEQFSQKKWYMEVAGQREILAAYGGVHLADIRGMRAPFLSVGGNKMFKMLYDSNFTYDSSMPVYENRPPSYPYTLDYKLFHDCMIPPCPTKSYPGVWEVPMVMWQDLNGGRCSMGDACSNPMNADNVYQMIRKNFDRHYTTNRAPFGLFYHAAWFTHQHHKEGFIKFLDEINQLSDVYILTNWQAIQWVREPTPLSHLKDFKPFDCDYTNRPKKCYHPKVCNLLHKSGIRYMRTCQPCPDIYPWTGKTGVRSSRVEN